MDALRVLEFSGGSFDLVNQRLGASWLRTWEWRKLLLEYQRVCRPGGIIRITEMNGIIENNSPALTKLHNISLQTFFRSGRLFSESNDGITGELVRLMTQHGIQDVQSQVHTLVFRAGTEAGQHFYEDMRHAYRVALPFFQKWTRIPDDYQETYQRALQDMQQPDFTATWTLLTAWGTRPTNGQTIRIRGLK
jgi:ubiquinone/menaquinone biosynthesis C-methylase UbiE